MSAYGQTDPIFSWDRKRLIVSVMVSGNTGEKFQFVKVFVQK